MESYFLSGNLSITVNISNDYLECIELESIKDKFKNSIRPYYNDNEFILYKDEKFYKRTNLNAELYLNSTRKDIFKLLKDKAVYAGFDAECIYKLNETTLIGVLQDEQIFITVYKEEDITLEEIILNYCLFGDHEDMNRLFLSNKEKLRSIVEI